MELNVVTANFAKGSHRVTSQSLWQWDTGQILEISGLELPDTFEVHFSNEQFDGNAKSQIGSGNRVSIPDEYLLSGKSIYVFIYLHQGADDGETKYVILIPVNRRPRPSHQVPTAVQMDEVSQLIAAMNAAADKAEQEADRAEDAKDAVLNLGIEVEILEPDAEASAVKTEDGETGAITLTLNIPRGIQGIKGDTGAVYLPHLSEEGILSWTNDAELDNPAAFDIVGAVLAALPAAEGGRF